jgi:hypothetical protein
MGGDLAAGLPALPVCCWCLAIAVVAVSNAEDPEKLLDQVVNEMQEDLIKMRQASAQVCVSSQQHYAEQSGSVSAAVRINKQPQQPLHAAAGVCCYVKSCSWLCVQRLSLDRGVLVFCSTIYRLPHACMRAGDGITEADGGKVQAGAGNSGELVARHSMVQQFVSPASCCCACMHACTACIHAYRSVQESGRCG